jgi:hypothetical protein
MSKRLVHDVEGTPHFNFLNGAYRLGKWNIPYFCLTMTIEEAAKSLHLTSEIPGSERINWKIDELYQRDIDWPRVEQGIVRSYLRDDNIPHFFNSITIALLPFNDSTNEVMASFDDPAFDPPPLKESERFARELTVGPISFGFWDSWKEPVDDGFHSGQLRWNRDQIFGVAIDGQHRLAALKILHSPGGVRNVGTRVPIILLLFDSKVGFRSPGGDAPTGTLQVELLRRLFIDLNKYAKVVSRARQILLDDRDPYALCVRRVAGNQLMATLEELQEPEPRLPLSLLDWHTEQAKFDDGPYLTTVLGLDWIVTRIFGTAPVGDYTQYGALRKQIKTLGSTLDVDLGAAFERLEQLATMKLSPFSYEENELELIGDAFARTWARPIIHLLTEFHPYKGLVEHRTHNGTLTLEFQHWVELHDRYERDRFAGQATMEYQQFLGRVQDHSHLGEAWFLGRMAAIDTFKAANLAFNVAFQRALVLAFLEYCRITTDEVLEIEPETEDLDEVDFDDSYAVAEEDDLDFGGEDEVGQAEEESQSATMLGSHLRERAEAFVSALNALVDAWPELLSLHASVLDIEGASQFFWSGTLLKPDGGIDFTQSASARAHELIFLAGAMSLYDSQTGPGQESDFDTFWEFFMYAPDAPSLCRRMRRSMKRFCDNPNTSAPARILKARGLTFTLDRARDEAYYRLKHIWTKFGL